MKKTIYAIATVLASCTLASCSDFLEADNKSAVTPEDQFPTETGVNALVTDAYFSLRAIHSNPIIFCKGTDAYTIGQGNAAALLDTYQYTSSESDVLNLYKNLYATIQAANVAIYYGEKAENFSGRLCLIDEARFVRNYAYFVLTQQFGAVPYIDQYIQTAQTSYPRTELKTIYDNIIADLNEIISAGNLPETCSKENAGGRASILAAKALLAKVELAAGWDIDVKATGDEAEGKYNASASSSYFTSAAKHAAEVADAVALDQSFADKWSPSNEGNKEFIFAIQYDRASADDHEKGGHNLQHQFGIYMGANTLGIKALRSDLAPTERVYYAFEPGDQRYEATFMTTIYNYNSDKDAWGETGYWGYYNSPSKLNSMPIAWHFFPWYTTDAEVDTYIAEHAAQFDCTGCKNKYTQMFRTAEINTAWIFKTNGTADASASASNTLQFSAAQNKIGFTPCVKKFDDPATSESVAQSSGSYRDIVIIDASDIYLSAAEAYLMANDQSNSLKYLNKVRNRAGVAELGKYSDYKHYDWITEKYVALGDADANGYSQTELDVILDERLRETLGQELRWMDLRRTKQLVRYNELLNANASAASMKGTDGKYKTLRPIPANEIKINDGITAADQNPGFAGDSEDEE